jgi:hypothetical protein
VVCGIGKLERKCSNNETIIHTEWEIIHDNVKIEARRV